MAQEQLSLSSIQKVLWKELHRVIDGKTTAASCNAVTNTAGKILSSAKLYLEHCKMTGKTPDANIFPDTAPKK
jgi:hypothetical protein